MAGGYRSPPGDGLGPLVKRLLEVERKLRNLAKPSGTNMASLVAQVQALIVKVNDTLSNIFALVADAISTQSMTTAQINAKVALPGDIAPGNVTASGEIVAGGRIRSGNLYGNILSVDYRQVYVTGVDGALGHVPSSRRFKRDIAPVAIDPAMIAALQLVNYRYIAAVEQLGDEAAIEWGLIAEEVHELGLTWLVDYDEEGQPFGVKYERLALAFIPYLQSMETRLSALEG